MGYNLVHQNLQQTARPTHLPITLLVATAAIYPVAGWPQAPCLAVALVVFARLISQNESPYQFRLLLLFVASLQWAVAPAVAYATDPNGHYKYFMYVDSGTYFTVVAPGLLAMAAGLFIAFSPKESREVRHAIERIRYHAQNRPDMPFFFLAIGFGATALGFVLPASLGFAVYLLAQLKFVAILLLLLSSRRDRFAWISAVFAILLVEAAASSMFHTIFLWGAVIGIFVAWQHGISVWSRVGMIVAVACAGLVIQSIKHEYRSEAWNGGQRSSAIFLDMALGRIGSIIAGNADVDGLLKNALIRVNQGWIISAVIRHVPVNEPFADGETIQTALVATFVPRFLMPSKAGAGGQDNFVRFTGLDLGKNTSMNISVLGDAYANFGSAGGALFMFSFGLAISLLLRFAIFLGRSTPLFIILLPVTMIQTVKAETDLVSVANYAFKSIILMYVIAYLSQRYFARSPVRP